MALQMQQYCRRTTVSGVETGFDLPQTPGGEACDHPDQPRIPVISVLLPLQRWSEKLADCWIATRVYGVMEDSAVGMPASGFELIVWLKFW
jgi:hypothetical protein